MKPLLFLLSAFLGLSLSAQNYYRFINAANGQVLDAYQTTGVPDQVGTYPWNGNDNQKWSLTQNSDGYYIITPKHAPDKALDVYQANNNTVGLFLVTGAPNQQWQLTNFSGNDFLVLSRAHNQYLSADSFPQNHGGRLIDIDPRAGSFGSSRQRWRVELVESITPNQPALPIIDTDKLYGIRSFWNSEFGVEVFNSDPREFNNIKTGKYWATQNQLWRFVPIEDDSSFHRIQHANSGLFMGITNPPLGSGNLVLRSENSFDSQRWRIVRQKNGTYQFINKVNGEVLTLDTISNQKFNVLQMPDSQAPNQFWFLETFETTPIYFGNYQIYHDNRMFGVSIGPPLSIAVGAQPIPYLDSELIDPSEHTWQLVPNPFGFLTIFSRITGGALSVEFNSEDGLFPLRTGPPTNLTNQNWRIINNTDGTIKLVNFDGQFLGFTGLEGRDIYATNGQRDGLNYDWNIRQAQQFTGYYRIVNKASGKALSLPGTSEEAGAILQVEHYDNFYDQVWSIESLGVDSYLIRNYNSEQVISLVNSSVNLGTLAEQQPFLGRVDQGWDLRYVDSQHFKITNRISLLALTADEENPQTGIQVYQTTDEDLDTQLWRIEGVNYDIFILPNTGDPE